MGIIKCPYCNKDYKQITAKHLEKHNKTYEEYLKEFNHEAYIEKLIFKFLDENYITVRYKYLVYSDDGATYTVNKNKIVNGEKAKVMPFNKKHLTEHIKHKRTYGILFPQQGSKLISFDIDVTDKTILENIYSNVNQYVSHSSILITESGSKGYHLDIFLDRILDRKNIKNFYNLILNETGLNKEQMELRGANGQGLKLPFGIHRTTNKYCGAVNEYGNAILEKDLDEILSSRTKECAEKIVEAVLINSEVAKEVGATLSISQNDNPLNDEEIIDFEEITEEIKPLINYNNLNENFIQDLTEIYINGFDGPGIRHNYIFKISLFLKCNMRFNQKDTLEEMIEWMKKCKNYNATEKEFEEDIKKTVDKIYIKDLKLTVAARKIKISKIEIKEILSIKCRTIQETKALRQLYYMMFLHSKAYADKDGVFYMTLDQMKAMGAVNRRNSLLNQINKLIMFNKIYKYPCEKISNIKYAPTKYKLIVLSEVIIELNIRNKLFTICNYYARCKDCIDKATDYLITDRNERQKYRKGKYLECSYNKR